MIGEVDMIFKSRKFWAAVVGLGIAVFGDRAGIDAVGLTAAVVVVVGYITGTALEDGLTARAR
jgi:hypothetical protein